MRRLRPLAFELLEDRVTPANLANGMPILNSFPSAPADIFLDFDGDTSAGTTFTPYDRDGNPTTFNAQEQADITEAWRQISVYFAPFNVNVTTIFTAARPKVWHVSSNSVSGGYSYVNVFPNSTSESYNQASDARGRFSGIAHEIGHNFGNSHQSAFNNLGVETADYISAVEPLRGYLMGVDFNGTVKKWSIGHTSNASSLQDDIATITNDLDNYGGDGYRPDDVGNTVGSAVAMTTADDVQSARGIIERLTDIDAYSFTSTGGRVAVTVAPDVPSGLDAILQVRDAGNNILAVADTVANGQTITMTLPAGTYYAFVMGKGNYSDIGQYDVTVKEGAPEGFQTANVGLMWNTGSTAYDSATGTWTVSGSGQDIWGTSDQFQYAYRALTGDGTITARVTGMDNTDNNAKAGVMIRESLDANSRHISSFMQYGQGSQTVYRTNTGGSSSSSGGGSTTFTPRWVRLIKSGNSITSQWSTNGTSWTTQTTRTITLGSTFYVGLAVTSHEDEETNLIDDVNDATFTNLSITGFSDPYETTNGSLAAPANLSATLGTGNAVSLSWDAVSGAAGYSIERSQDGGHSFIPLGSTAFTTSYSDSNPLGSQTYWYRVRATSAGGRSDATAPVEITNRPSAVRSLEVTAYSTSAIVLDWLDTDGETGFRVERSTDGGANYQTVANVGKNIPSYTSNGLTTGVQYRFRVTPLSSLGDGTPQTIDGFTRLATVSGLGISATATSVTVTWADISGDNGYRIERSTDATTFTSVGTVGANVTSYTQFGLATQTEYYYRVVGINLGTESINPSAVAMAATLPSTPIPAPWLSLDIGTVATQSGASALNGSTFKVISGGANIGGSADAFRFTYQQLTGNGAITARVDTLEATGGTSGTGPEIGVMIRESLAAGSRNVSVNVTQNSGVQMQRRSGTNSSTTLPGTLAGLTAPYWVRIVRSGDSLVGYASPDGEVWTQVGSTTLSSLPGTVFIGLGAAAGTTSLLNTSTYTNVSIDTVGVESSTIDDGTIQRSMLRTARVDFTGLVNLGANPAQAFLVIKAGGGNPAFTVDLGASTPTQTIATLTFTNPLADGDYTLVVFANSVTSAEGVPMANNYTHSFHRLFGDIDGNRTVNSADFAQFGATFGVTQGSQGYYAAFDFNGDGIVEATDFAEFGARFGVTI